MPFRLHSHNYVVDIPVREEKISITRMYISHPQAGRLRRWLVIKVSITFKCSRPRPRPRVCVVSERDRERTRVVWKAIQANLEYRVYFSSERNLPINGIGKVRRCVCERCTPPPTTCNLVPHRLSAVRVHVLRTKNHLNLRDDWVKMYPLNIPTGDKNDGDDAITPCRGEAHTEIWRHLCSVLGATRALRVVPSQLISISPPHSSLFVVFRPCVCVCVCAASACVSVRHKCRHFVCMCVCVTSEPISTITESASSTRVARPPVMSPRAFPASR